MSPIPVSKSFIQTSVLAHTLETAYALANVRCQLITATMRDVYLVRAGRRRFVFLILVGGVWAFLWVQLLPSIFPTSLEYRVIGWVIPGLIANHLDRQGLAVTAASLVTVTVAIGFLGRLLSLV